MLVIKKIKKLNIKRNMVLKIKNFIPVLLILIILAAVLCPVNLYANSFAKVIQVLDEIKDAVVNTGKLVSFIFSIFATFSKWVGFKVLVFLIIAALITILFTNTLNLSGRTGFLISILITAVFWYLWNITYNPEGNGGIFTILKIIISIIIIFTVILFINKVTQKTVFRLKIRALIKKRKKIVSSNKPIFSIEKYILKLNELIEELKIFLHKYEGELDETRKKSIKIRIEELKNDIIRHMKTGADY